jgi:hypothetical protein
MYITQKNKDYGYTGPAEFYDKDLKTVGEFVNGKLNGLAIVQSDASTTVAEWEDDKIIGCYAVKEDNFYDVGITGTNIGTKILKDGSMFVGDWREDSEVNYGVVYSENGTFIGKIINEVPVICDTGKWIARDNE